MNTTRPESALRRETGSSFFRIFSIPTGRYTKYVISFKVSTYFVSFRQRTGFFRIMHYTYR